jgi:hypothetical protein
VSGLGGTEVDGAACINAKISSNMETPPFPHPDHDTTLKRSNSVVARTGADPRLRGRVSQTMREARHG